MFEPYIHWSELTSNLAISAASIAAPLLGIFGFRSWRRELAGKTKYQFAHKLLSNVYMIRDKVITIRNPFFEATELWKECTDMLATHGFHPDDINPFRQEARAYLNRVSSLVGPYNTLHILTLEAEALFPDDSKDLFKALYDHLNKLFAASRVYYNREKREDSLENLYKMLVRHSEADVDDEYELQLKQLIEKIEYYFKPYLR